MFCTATWHFSLESLDWVSEHAAEVGNKRSDRSAAG